MILYDLKILCDAKELCSRQFNYTDMEVPNFSSHLPAAEKMAQRNGWTIVEGKHFCPDHPPSPSAPRVVKGGAS